MNKELSEIQVKKNDILSESFIINEGFQAKDIKTKSEPLSKIITQEDLNNLIVKNKNQPFSFSKLDLTKPEEEYLSISVDIHSILSNYPDLTSNQKLDYCNSQRYFMKLYLKEVLIKINKL